MEKQRSSTSSFKQFLYRFLLPLLLLFVACGFIFQYAFEQLIIVKSQISGPYKINRIIKEYHPNEIAMFGSSRMIGGLIPDSLGPNYFNYGLNGVKDNVVQFFLTQELQKKKTTPIIINLDINGLHREIGDLLYYLYNVDNSSIERLVGAYDKCYYHLPFIKYFGNYEYYLKDYLSSRIALTKVTNKGASIEKKAELPEIFAQQVSERSNTPETFSNDTELLANLITMIKQHPERKFVFVIAPCHSSCFKRYQNETGELAFFNGLKSQKNVRLFNFSRDNYADSLFFNTEHLNYQGAVKYSCALRDSLAKM